MEVDFGSPKFQPFETLVLVSYCISACSIFRRMPSDMKTDEPLGKQRRSSRVAKNTRSVGAWTVSHKTPCWQSVPRRLGVDCILRNLGGHLCRHTRTNRTCRHVLLSCLSIVCLMYLSIYLSIYLSVCLAIHQNTYLPAELPIYRATQP